VHDAHTRFYNDFPPGEAAHWALKIHKHSRLAYASPLTYAAYKAFPSSYLFMTRDAAVPLFMQQRLAHAAGITETAEVDAGHFAVISCPGGVKDFIRRSAGEQIHSARL